MIDQLVPIWEALLAWDIRTFYLINHARTPFLDVVMPFITDFDNWIPLVVVTWLWLVIRGGKKGRIAAVGILLVILLADQTASSIFKPLFKRLRPCIELPDAIYWSRKKSYSFVSSHAANMFGLATYFSVNFPKTIPVVLLIAFSVSYSRIYIGVHYPLDVIGGAIVGIYWASFVLILERIITQNLFPKLNPNR
ncbi:MAG: phosphatase PAP2 family protein [Gemmatimonadetes bacterium]|nr:MAG: phosphatase PAP2 family protein [Gemmatimonadota bacterium]